MTILSQEAMTVQGQDSPTPEDIKAARSLPRDLVGRAVGDWHEARRRLNRAEELMDFDPSLGPWMDLEAAALRGAERLLLRIIRTAAVDRELPAARGFHLDGDTFLAVGVGDDPEGWRLVVVPGEAFDAALEFRPDLHPRPVAGATERPGWLVRALAEVDRLGPVEASRRLFGTTAAGREAWRETLHFTLREWGRRETFRRLGIDDASLLALG